MLLSDKFDLDLAERTVAGDLLDFPLFHEDARGERTEAREDERARCFEVERPLAICTPALLHCSLTRMPLVSCLSSRSKDIEPTTNDLATVFTAFPDF